MPTDPSYHPSLSRYLAPDLAMGGPASLLPRPCTRDDNSDDGRPHPRTSPSLMRYATPLIKERLPPANGEFWQLSSILDEARDGGVASLRPIFPWNREQIEALWHNIANGWSIGMVVAIDASGCSTLPWPARFGPWPTRIERATRTSLLVGAAKLSALAWSLSERPTAIEQRMSPEETATWSRYTLVADTDLRRIRFISGEVDPIRHLPVRLFPESAAYVEALNRMKTSALEREWLNRTARRLLEAQLSVYLFGPKHLSEAEAMIENFRQIGMLP